jgi:hypothetical protein
MTPEIVVIRLPVWRFDLLANASRVHMEDFAQVFGLYPNNKSDQKSMGNRYCDCGTNRRELENPLKLQNLLQLPFIFVCLQ